MDFSANTWNFTFSLFFQLTGFYKICKNTEMQQSIDLKQVKP